MNRFKLGIVLETTGLPVRRALQEVAKLGVHGVQIDAAGALAPDRLTETGRREFRNLLKTYNLELSALNCPLRRGLVPLPKGQEDAAAPRALTAREALTALGSFGDRVGTVLALEAGLDPGEKVRDYLNSFDTGSLLANFDPANFLLNGYDPLASLAALAGKVSHTHARDARTATAGGGAREVPVGAGDVEWMVYVATLESIDYRGFLTVDRESGEDRYADAAAGVRFLRRFTQPTGS